MNLKKILMVSALLVTMAAPAMAQTNTAITPVTAVGSATTPGTPKSEVGRREENQQDRIAQGVKSGQLTAGETARLETHEAGISKEIKTDRTDNGGKLTAAEKAKVNRQQNRLSANIYNKKHNNRVQ